MESGNSAYNPAGQSTLSAPPPSPTSLFHNEHGLRAGWRLLVYLLLVLGGGVIVMLGLRLFLTPKRGVPTAMILLSQEVVGFALVYGAALVMSRLERRSVGAYGLPSAGTPSGAWRCTEARSCNGGCFICCCSSSLDCSRNSCFAATCSTPWRTELVFGRPRFCFPCCSAGCTSATQEKAWWELLGW